MLDGKIQAAIDAKAPDKTVFNLRTERNSTERRLVLLKDRMRNP